MSHQGRASEGAIQWPGQSDTAIYKLTLDDSNHDQAVKFGLSKVRKTGEGKTFFKGRQPRLLAPTNPYHSYLFAHELLSFLVLDILKVFPYFFWTMADKTTRPRPEDIFTAQDDETSHHTPKRQKRSTTPRYRSNSPEVAFYPALHRRPGSPTTVHPVENGSQSPIALDPLSPIKAAPTAATPEERRRRASLDPTNLGTSRSPYAVFHIDPVDESSAAVNPSLTFRIGTRKSKLARIQTESIATVLQYAYPTHTFPVQPMSTAGDLNKVTPLYQFDAKALWTRELEVALLEGEIDMIVHSLKDMPTTLPEGCALGAITAREDPRDTAVFKAGLEHCKSLDDLAEGSIIGTSSVRRIAQLRRAHPHLQFADVRGNVDTRLRKLDHSTDPDFSAIILAEAGLARMGIQRHRIQIAGPTLLHAVGQGSLGVEIRTGDEKTKELLKPLNHRESRLRCLAERSLMRALEGGCSVPIGVETEMNDEKLTLRAILVTVDGSKAIDGTWTVFLGEVEGEEEDDTAERLGLKVASDMKAAGAQELLEAIRLEKEEHLERGTDVIANDERPVAKNDWDGERTVVDGDIVPVLKALAANGE